MLKENAIEAGKPFEIMGKVRDYKQLLKPNLSGMVVFTSVIGYLMAPNISFVWHDLYMWKQIILLFAGGMMITGSANTINQILERESDALMRRTKLRPLPDGRMAHQEAWVFAVLLGIAGGVMLSWFFNLQTGILSIISLLLYAFAYTPMKKIHPVAVLIGAIPGALPPLIGWVAATGQFSFGGWLLFVFQFLWQFPHFWAIAWVAYEDYSNAGIKMLPTKEKESRVTGVYCMLYSIILLPVAMLAHSSGLTGSIGMWVCILAGLVYFAASVVFYMKNDHKSARRVMFASFIYLPVIMIALLMDKI